MKRALKSRLAAIALAATMATSAFADANHVNVTPTDLALRGVDPVSYFTEGHPLDG